MFSFFENMGKYLLIEEAYSIGIEHSVLFNN